MEPDEIAEHIDGDDGFCTNCQAWTVFGGVEPDAREYLCPECGAPTVYGAEEALIMGLLEND